MSVGDPRPQRTEPALASAEIVAFLKSHSSSCGGCGLILSGCRIAECPACHWPLDLETLKQRETTVANIVRDADWLCPQCNYNLRGSPGDQCPECGAALSPKALVDPNEKPAASRRPKTAGFLIGLMAAAVSSSIAVGMVGMFSKNPGAELMLIPVAVGGVVWIVVFWVLTPEDKKKRKR